MEKDTTEKALKKSKKRVKQLETELLEMQEQYDALQDMMQMTANHMHSIRQELEKTNKHMLDSIHYALRIQQAMMDTEEQARQVFPHNFIMHKPKDILSGDLYWFKESAGLSFAAVIDCTGHGVPAAMLTVLALSLINQTITTFGITDPAEILMQLDSMLAQYTRNEAKVKQVRDGMDIVICRYDESNRELVVAGAHRPLYLVRNGELHDLKGAKYSLGNNDNRVGLIHNHSIFMAEGDMVYMFSDGFPDQFGGPDQRKYMVGQFKKLLLEIAAMPLDLQQSKLEEVFSGWKGEQVQTDDVLVVGIRF